MEFNIGDKVHYDPKYGAKENGIVKGVKNEGDIIFVVYKCNNDWDNYTNYTGAATSPQDLKLGWYEKQPEGI